MITLDSMTIAIDRSLVDVNEKHFTKTVLPNGSIAKMSIKPDIIGINNIEVLDSTVRVSVSAKILLEQYKLGINQSTINQVFQAINNTSIIKLNSNKLADYTVHMCDFVANLYVKTNHDNYYNALNMISNHNYQNKKYKNGFAFIGQQVVKNKYLKFYDKVIELNQPCNKLFVNKVGLQQLQNDFMDIIRVECRAITFKQIKAYANIDSNKLDCLLSSNANPLYKAFNEVCRGNTIQQYNLLSFDSIKTFKDYDMLIVLIAYQVILNMFNNDIARSLDYIRDALKLIDTYPSNLSRKIKECKTLLQNASQTNLYSAGEVNRIDYIKEMQERLLEYVR